MLKIGVIGGGAAGFFSALRHKELYPDHEVFIFEKTSKVLGKVRISGGGRCNVTHACYDVRQLVQYYPRGAKELIGPFHRFQPLDTIKWFEERGVALKTEPDGRMFPVTDQSQTIIDCFLNEAQRLGVIVHLKHELTGLDVIEDDRFVLKFKEAKEYTVDRLIVTTGSNETTWNVLNKIGHHIFPPVPSLFTFNINDDRLIDFPGVTWPEVQITEMGSGKSTLGPLLITHWGLSGPAVLKLSAVAAIQFSAANYHFNIQVNFMHPKSTHEVLEDLMKVKQAAPNKMVSSTPLNQFTSRIWQSWVKQFGLGDATWQSASKKELMMLSEKLTRAEFNVAGKSTYKEEFVTCGGIDLKEVDMKTMQSKKIKNLYFAGEVLNIDALTGGYNFQAAWTTGWIAGETKG